MKHIIAFMLDSEEDAQKAYDATLGVVGTKGGKYLYQRISEVENKDAFLNAGTNIGLAMYKAAVRHG